MNKKWLFGLIPAAIIALGIAWIAWGNTALSSREIAVSDDRLPESSAVFGLRWYLTFMMQNRCSEQESVGAASGRIP